MKETKFGVVIFVLFWSVLAHVVLIFLSYDFGEESDLFKAPELTVEEPMLAVDPLSLEIVELIQRSRFVATICIPVYRFVGN